MPLAAYSYPHTLHSAAGSGVNRVHPAPPVLADGLYYYPPAPYPCPYNPHYAGYVPPHYSSYPLPPSCPSHQISAPCPRVQYPHYHFCPGAPYCSATPGGFISSPMDAWQFDSHADSRSAQAHCPHGPTSLPDGGSHQPFYPQVFGNPSRWKLAEPGVSGGDAANASTDAQEEGKVNLPSLSFNDKLQGSKPPRWRGFPVFWEGGAPIAIVPLSNIDGEQNLFVPKTSPLHVTQEEPQKSIETNDKWQLPPGDSIPVMWKQSSLPQAIQENNSVKPHATESDHNKVSSAVQFPMAWDGKVPIVVMPARKDSGEGVGNSSPYVLMPAAKEAGVLLPHVSVPAAGDAEQSSITLPTSAVGSAEKGDGHGSIKPFSMSSAAGETEEKSKLTDNQKGFTANSDVSVKVIPIVQQDSSAHKVEVIQNDSSTKRLPKNEAASNCEKAGGDETRVQAQALKPDGKDMAGKEFARNEHKDPKSVCKDAASKKKGFPAIKLVPPSDVKRCKSPLKSSVEQGKHAGPESVESARVKASGPARNKEDQSCRPGLNIVSEVGNPRNKSLGCSGETQIDSSKAMMVPVSGSEEVSRQHPITKIPSMSAADEADRRSDADQNLAVHDEDHDAFASKVGKEHEHISKEASAMRIQAAYRGYRVRKSKPLTQLQVINEVKVMMPNLLKQMDKKAELQMKPMEQRKLAENIMALLLKLDTVQGQSPFVREQRKAVAQALSSMLEKLDDDGEENELSVDKRCISNAMTDGAMGSLLMEESNGELKDDEMTTAAIKPLPETVNEKDESSLCESHKILSRLSDGCPSRKGSVVAEVEAGELPLSLMESNIKGESEVGDERTVGMLPCGSLVEQEVEPSGRQVADVMMKKCDGHHDLDSPIDALKTDCESFTEQNADVNNLSSQEIREAADKSEGLPNVSSDWVQPKAATLCAINTTALNPVIENVTIGQQETVEMGERSELADAQAADKSVSREGEVTVELALLQNEERMEDPECVPKVADQEDPECISKVADNLRKDDKSESRGFATNLIVQENDGKQDNLGSGKLIGCVEKLHQRDAGARNEEMQYEMEDDVKVPKLLVDDSRVHPATCKKSDWEKDMKEHGEGISGQEIMQGEPHEQLAVAEETRSEEKDVAFARQPGMTSDAFDERHKVATEPDEQVDAKHHVEAEESGLYPNPGNILHGISSSEGNTSLTFGVQNDSRLGKQGPFKDGVMEEDNQLCEDEMMAEDNLLCKDGMMAEDDQFCTQLDVGKEGDACVVGREVTRDATAMDECDGQAFENMKMDVQNRYFEDLAIESKSLLSTIEKLAVWNQQAATMLTQLSERMDRLEKASNSKHIVKEKIKGCRGRVRRVKHQL